jgi:hypothetical protein
MSKYNGYTNYATWNFVLWAGNEEWSYKMVARTVARLRDFGNGIDAFEAEVVFRAVVGDTTPDGAEASDVDWDNVAENLQDWE